MAELPKQYKACVYDSPGSVSTKVEMLDMPEPSTGEVLINLTHSGVCHSDYSVMTQSWKGMPFPTPKGQVGGHEGVGKVVKLGPGCESSGLRVGDRVGIKWIASACGHCSACLAAPAADGLCFNRKISGYYFPGSFQQYAIGPATYVTKIPDGLSSEVAAPMLCAGVTTYTALRKSGAKSGQWVVIAGAGGGLGHIATQLSAKGMAHRVIGIDAGAKEKLVLESGAEHFLDIGKFKDDDSIVEEVKKLTGGLGAHAAIVCTSSNRAYAQALRFLRFNGTLVCVGIPEGGLVPIASADPFSLVVEQKTITAVAVGNREEANEVLAFAARGVVKADVRIEPMEKLTDVFKEMEKGQLSGRVVLDLS